MPEILPTTGLAGCQTLVRRATCWELASAFARTTLISFGGGAPWVKRMVVDEKRWLTLEEFAEVLSLCQTFPGAVFFNLAVAIGVREQGTRGGLAALGGILLPAFIIACTLERLEASLENVVLHRVLDGVAAAAAGLFSSTCAQTSVTAWKRLGFPGMILAVCALVAIVHLKISLPLVLLIFVPLGTLLAWRKNLA